MRLGVFSNAYRPLISGVVNSVDLIRKGMLARGHQVHLFAPKVQGFNEQHAGVWRFPSLELTREVQYPLALPFWPPLHRLIGRAKFEVLHTHHPFLLGDYAWYWAKRQSLPLVYTFHTQYEQYCHYVKLPQAPLKALTRWAVSHFARRCDLLIAPSPAIRELLDQYGIKTWTETLPNAIDLSRFQHSWQKAEIRRQLGLPTQAPLAIYAGRIGKEKNLTFLLSAFARLQEPGHLMIVGDGPQLSSLKQMAAELEIAERVHFSGRVAYENMSKYYAAADFFVMSSTTEVKPLVVLEALASGLPVLAVAACGTSDTLRHGFDGWLTEEHQEPFLVGWRHLLTHHQDMKHAALQTASDYAIAPYCQRLESLYLEAIARKQHPVRSASTAQGGPHGSGRASR